MDDPLKWSSQAAKAVYIALKSIEEKVTDAAEDIEEWIHGLSMKIAFGKVEQDKATEAAAAAAAAGAQGAAQATGQVGEGAEQAAKEVGAAEVQVPKTPSLGSVYKAIRTTGVLTHMVGADFFMALTHFMGTITSLLADQLSESPTYWEKVRREPRKMRADQRILSEMQRLAYTRLRKLDSDQNAVSGTTYDSWLAPRGAEAIHLQRAFFLKLGQMTPGYDYDTGAA